MPLKLRRRKRRWRRSEPYQHSCDLVLGSESNLPQLPPNAKCSVRFKRRLQKVLLVSAGHPFTRFYLRSKAAIAFEKRRHGVSSHWWIIHPCSSFRFIWDIVMTLTFLYMFFMVPYTLAFNRMSNDGSDVIGKTLNLLTPGYAICLVDIVFNFVTGFISRDGHEIFINPTLTVKHYLRGSFAVDLISSVPYTWFYRETLQRPQVDVKIYLLFLEILPLLKFFRLYKLRHYIKQLVVAYGASRNHEHGIWITLMTILIFHCTACFTYAFPFFYAYLTKTPIESAEGYIFREKIYNQPNWFIYLTNLHMGAANLCSFNFDEVVFTALPDKVMRCIFLLFGMSYFLYVIVIVLQLIASSTEPELKYQTIIHGVKDYIKNKKLTKEMKDRLLHFYEHRYQGSLFKEKAITSTLSVNLKNEITYQSSRILLEATSLFNNTPRSLFDSVIGVLKQVIFLQDDIIYKCGMEGKCMYFIITGTVAILTFSGKEVCHLQDGDYFGEIALFENTHKRVTTAIALEVCEVLRLDRRSFNRLVTPTTDLFTSLQKSANSKVRIVADMENGHLNGESINETQDSVDQ